MVSTRALGARNSSSNLDFPTKKSYTFPSSNGRTADFESVNYGSIPWGKTMRRW